MRYELQQKCDGLLDLYWKIRGSANMFDSDRILLCAASLYLTSGREFHPLQVEHCRKILKRRHGMFSKFRSYDSFIVACKMSMSEDPETYLWQLEDIAAALQNDVLSVNRTVLAAMILLDNVEERGIDYLTAKTNRIYRRMKNTHSLLTNGDDLPLAALMAVSENDGQTCYENAEAAFTVFKRDLKAGRNTIQFLSHIVSLYYGDIEDMCQKIIDIAENLYRRKHGLGTDIHLAILGPLADMPCSAYELVDDIIDADNCLSFSKPFRGIFGITGRERRIYATICTLCAGLDEESARRSAMVTTSVELTIIYRIMMAAAAAA